MHRRAPEHLAARVRADAEHEDDERVAGRRRGWPGKRSHDDDSSVSTTPGKQTLADVGRDALSPPDSLRWAAWLDRGVDRQADGAAEVDGGSLATAFEFVDGARAGQPLPDELRRRLARELAVDLSAVRIHTDAAAAAAAAALNARAFAIGDDIYFAAGAYDPTSDAGIELIAHEVAHVAQQRGGQAKPRRVSRPDDTHEREAHAFAHTFRTRTTKTFDTRDPAELVEQVRREGQRIKLPYLAELEQHFGQSFDFVETYTGEATRIACQLMGAGAFAVRNIVALAEPSANRDQLMHELTHIVQMGGRSAIAPERFVPGSLTIGTSGSAVEHEADAHATRPAHAASPDTIHRTPTDGTASGPPTLADAQRRIREWASPTVQDHSALGSRHELGWGKRGAPAEQRRYYHAQSSAWTSTRYANAGSSHRTEDITTVMDAPTSDANLGQSYRLHRVGSSYVVSKKLTTNPAWDAYEQVVERTQVPSISKWEAYWGDGVTGSERGIKALDNITFTWGDVWDQDHPPTTEEEFQTYRHAMETAIAQKYATMDGPGKWHTFYKNVVLGMPGPATAASITPPTGARGVFRHPYKRIVGNIFERIVGMGTDSAGPEHRVTAEQLVITWKQGGSEQIAIADGMLEPSTGSMRLLAECKAWTRAPGTTEREQARRYKRITSGTIGYKGGGDDPQKIFFNHVVYYFAHTDVANLWWPMLEEVFELGEHDPASGPPAQLSVVPRPSVLGEDFTFRVQYNPTFEIPVPRGQTHVTSTAGIRHPGVNVTAIDLRLNAERELQSGHITAGIDMANGAVHAEPRRQPITPGTGNEGRVDNRFTGLRTGLARVLGERIQPDARLTDDGVEASVTITEGSSGIPGFNLTGGSLTIRYGEAGLAVTGNVGLSRQIRGKTVSGNLTVGWTGGAWTVSGEVSAEAGLVDGLGAFTCGFAYEGGETTITCDQASISKTFGAITLTGTARGLSYNVNRQSFSGSAEIEADLGMFGRASATATIENNELARAELSYDSPELTYPRGSTNPTLRGTVGGTVVYTDGRFSGRIRGTAGLNVPMLQRIAGEGGLGLAVDAHINADGTYGGTVRTTTPLQFGRHFRIPSISCTINDDGSISGDFSIAVVNFRYLERAQIDCRIDATGFTVVAADIRVPFGTPNESRFWGSLAVTYAEGAGLRITGDVSATIRPGMVAHGTLTYSTETDVVDIRLGIDEIRIFDYGPRRHNLFQFSRQFPIASFYNIIGIYLDIGFDLDFEYEMSLGLRPEITLEGLNMETWEYTRAQAEITLLGQLAARLIATPSVGLGLFAVSPSLLRGGGGIRIPITGEALLRPSGTIRVGYTPSGGVEGDASIGMSLTFGIRGAVRPYAEASVLDGVWNPTWTGDALTEFEILPPKELFNFTLDLGGDMSTREPTIPSAPAAPTGNTAARQVEQEEATTREVGGDSPGREATPPTAAPATEEPTNDMFNMSTLMGALRGLPGYATISRFMQKAGEVWDRIRGFFGRVAGAFRDFFQSIADQIEEVLDGFARQGLGYLPTLIRKLVGDSVYEIISPIVDAVASSAAQILELFETDPPRSIGEFFTWSLKLARRAFGLAFDGIGNLVSAVRTIFSRLGDAAIRVVGKMVTDGMIGVRRHCYYVWNPNPWGSNWYFLAATEYKIHVLGVDLDFREDGMITSPGSVVGVALFEVLEAMGVPPTYVGWDRDAGDSFRDRWA